MKASADEQAQPGPSRARRRRWPGRLRQLGIVAGILVVLAAVSVGSVEHYTSQPTFCGSCHIMDMYYTSWSRDVHATTDQQRAACVDCHYAPGQQHTLKAKFRGLSQVMSYFSGRSGAGRPKAHVQDASCLRAGCHEDRAYLHKDYEVGNVAFSHEKHLDPNGDILRQKQTQLDQLRQKLRTALGPERIEAINVLAAPVTPAGARQERLEAWLQAEGLSAWRQDVLEYGELLHTEVRIDQLSGLKCASCHQFDPSLEKHFTVAKTTCYTCHFINQPFNAGTARCLNCHKPPAGPVPIHYGQHPYRQAAASAPSQGVTMDHALIIANNVNCSGCHIDLVHGTPGVTRRDCQNCHDQQRYLRDFEHLTTDVVREYHRLHTAEQRARCNDCHELIDHRLVPLPDPRSAVALLAPVRQDCDHCHPQHHREQVDLLLGQGGFVQGAEGTPNPMTGSRANCRACHTQPGADPKGEMVFTAVQEVCRGCHGEDYVELFARWQHGLEARLDDARQLLTSVEQRLALVARQLPPRDLAPTRQLVERAKRNVLLVASANGLHNDNYAMMLLDQAVIDLQHASANLLP
jgi:predicted CXXCH cytochrome family protein